jgi:hypothetical protein
MDDTVVCGLVESFHHLPGMQMILLCPPSSLRPGDGLRWPAHGDWDSSLGQNGN